MSAQQLPTVCPDVYNIGNYSGSEFASYTVSSNGEGKNKKYELKDEKVSVLLGEMKIVQLILMVYNLLTTKQLKLNNQ